MSLDDFSIFSPLSNFVQPRQFGREPYKEFF